MAGTRIDTPSTDASVDADTDVEGFIISEDWSVKEYTLGKAFFQFTLLADLVSSSDADKLGLNLMFVESPSGAANLLTLSSRGCPRSRGDFRTRQSF